MLRLEKEGNDCITFNSVDIKFSSLSINHPYPIDSFKICLIGYLVARRKKRRRPSKRKTS